MAIKKAAFAAGCFWHIEFKFSKLNGIKSTQVGYEGGDDTDSKVTYEKVSKGLTSYAETVELTYDDKIIDYNTLLDEFWNIHDPTTKDKQGPDIGHQYRSVIFYFDDEQKNKAEKSRNEHQKVLKNKIVTEIIPASVFHKAEEYHQNYLKKQGKSSCDI